MKKKENNIKDIEQVRINAPAKINLALEVRGVRADGFHEVRMIMQSIDLCDRLNICKQEQDIELQVAGAELPNNSDNLAYRAAELILEKAGYPGGVCINLTKKIPVAAGLAGGSTDAAAVLTGINYLYDLNYSYKQLQELASILGSDTVFCLQGGTALASGRGEKITQLEEIPEQDLLLVNPDFEVATARIYQEYDRIKPEKKVGIKSLIAAINSGREITGDEGWFNLLEPVTTVLFPDVLKIKKQLEKCDIKMCMMSGSGPTVFALLRNREQGQQIVDSWPREEDKLFLTTTKTKVECFADKIE